MHLVASFTGMGSSQEWGHHRNGVRCFLLHDFMHLVASLMRVHERRGEGVESGRGVEFGGASWGCEWSEGWARRALYMGYGLPRVPPGRRSFLALPWAGLSMGRWPAGGGEGRGGRSKETEAGRTSLQSVPGQALPVSHHLRRRTFGTATRTLWKLGKKLSHLSGPPSAVHPLHRPLARKLAGLRIAQATL